MSDAHSPAYFMGVYGRFTLLTRHSRRLVR